MIAKPAATAGTWGRAKATAPAPIVQMSRGHSRLSRVRAGLTSGSEGWVRAPARSEAIGPEAPARRPDHTPRAAAITHHAAAKAKTRSAPRLAAPATVTAARTVADAAVRRTV